MPSPEDRPEISVYQGSHIEAEISETDTTFTAKIRSSTGEIILFQYSPPGKVSVEIVSFAPPGSPAPEIVTGDRPQQSQTAEAEQSAETEKAVKLYGRSATEPFHATAPSGEPMVIVQFAEHPSWHEESFGNKEAGRIKDDTPYWQAAAFGEAASLLDGLPKGKASILIGYPKAYTKVGKGGKEEVISNGFQVVDRKAYPGTPKPRKP